MKKFLSFLAAVCLLFTLCGCHLLSDIMDSVKNDEEKAKIFEFDGISIELTTDFLRMDFIDEDYEFVVGTDDVAVFGIKAPFADTEFESYTAKEYAEHLRSAMEDSDPTELAYIEGIPTYQYSAVEDGERQTVAVTVYKATDCFWVLCFGAETDDFAEEYGDICRYAKTVKCR